MAPLNASMSFPVGILFINVFMTTAATVFLALRLWTRYEKNQRLQLNDWTVIAAWILFFGMEIAMNIAIVQGGLGQPIENLTPRELETLAKAFVPCSILGIPSVALAKISACDLFNKLFPSKKFHIASYTVMGVLTAYAVAFTITTLLSCRPFSLLYDKTVPGTCIDTSTYYTAATSIGVAMDVMVVVLPMPVVWNLQMNSRQKWNLTILFGLGLLICAISIGRATVTANSTFLANNYSAWAGLTVILATIEAALSIMVVCMPLLRTVSTKVGSTLRSLLSKRSNNSSNQDSSLGSQPPRAQDLEDGRSNKIDKLHNHLFPTSKDDTAQYLSYGSSMTQVEGGKGLDFKFEVASISSSLDEQRTCENSIVVTKDFTVRSESIV